MSEIQKKPEEPKKGAPAYIVTFSDMITLLLTFFVLLLSLADDQDKGLFSRGQNSFRRAVADFGMAGVMFSKNQGSRFSHPKIKYKIDKGDDEPEDRTVDSATETFRQILQDIEKTMKISPSQITCRTKNFTVTDVKFKDGSWKLSPESISYIENHANQVKQSLIDEKPAFYIVGLAGSEKSLKDQWVVSAKRAQAVADHMKKLFPEWPIYSWGAGNGGEWTSRTGMFTKETDIIIAQLMNE